MIPTTIPEQIDLSAAANTATVETAKVWLSWPELIQSPQGKHTSGEWFIVPLTNMVAFMDRGICLSILSMGHTKRRAIIGALCVASIVACSYIGCVYLWPTCRSCKAMWPDNWFVHPYLKRPFFRFGCSSDNDASQQGLSDSDSMDTNDEPTNVPTTEAPVSDTTLPFTRTRFMSSIALPKNMIPSLLQRAYSTIRSRPVESDASSEVTVLLERKSHQWFETLQHHHSKHVVGVSIRVPGSLVFENGKTFTFNRWLDVEIRRAPVTDSPVFLWTNTLSYEALSPSEDDGMQLSSMLQKAVKVQFDRAHQPLPMLQYRVHNHLCDPQFSTHYGLDLATLIAGTIAGTLLGGASLSDSYQSLSQFSLDISQRCQQTWLMCPTPKITMVPLDVYHRISAALWETDSESDSNDEDSQGSDDTLSTLSLSEDAKSTQCTSKELVYATLNEPVMICGQLVRIDGKDSPTEDEWPIAHIQQSLRTGLKHVIKSKESVTCMILERGEVMVKTTAPYGLTVQQLVTQSCRENGCQYEHHFVTKLYRGDMAHVSKVRQTWVSSIEFT